MKIEIMTKFDDIHPCSFNVGMYLLVDWMWIVLKNVLTNLDEPQVPVVPVYKKVFTIQSKSLGDPYSWQCFGEKNTELFHNLTLMANTRECQNIAFEQENRSQIRITRNAGNMYVGMMFHGLYHSRGNYK